MEIRNVMEERVLSLVNEIADEEEDRGSGRYCTSEQCRMDAACYVLNRIPQRYVTSGRGFAYLQTDLQENLQLQIDMVTLAHEGFQRVSSIQRSFYGDGIEASSARLTGDWYFFYPTIRGRLFNAINFEPVTDLSVRLLQAGSVVEMIDSRWSNPCQIVVNNPGTYLFWPHPKLADSPGIESSHDFVLEVDDPRFTPIKHWISLPVQSEPVRSPRALIRDFVVTDLFLMPREVQEDTMTYSVVDEDVIV